MAQLKLNNIVKHYEAGQPVIRGINLEIGDGEFVVFVGPSGCGKSTLLRMIAGLEQISSGELLIDDKLANNVPPAERGLAMVFQSYALYPHMSVYENMAFALTLAGKKRAEVDEAVQKAAQILQIEHLLKRKPKDLSGGQRQRVAIGRAIVRKPKVFLFDEPLSNLDASLRVQMRVELSRLHQELRTTMIYVTHDQVEAMTLGDRIVVFNGGHIEQVGTPLELYNNPGNMFVAGFLGSPKMNFVPAEVVARADGSVELRLASGSSVHVAVDGSTIEAGNAVTVGIRAEHASIAEAPTPNAVPARVGHVEHLGDVSIVYVQLEGVAEMLAVKQAQGAANHKAGDAVFVMLPVQHCHVFDATCKALPRVA
ncbi:MAG TPA: sn-glycerol-3-phosphate ABC transporter ATP-binding protein UgpC [Burkholderiaceae bacterium]|jgi:multiple sugar transport system ATP-binding protein